MYLRTEEIRREFVRVRDGKSIAYTRKTSFAHLKCDNCGSLFKRQVGNTIAAKRCNNDVGHYCSDCPAQSIAGIEGQKTRKANLKKKIGQVRYVSAGKGKGKYAWEYVGEEYPYSKPYCGSILQHIKMVEEHLGRTLKKGECVHHIDGDKLNNDINNLDVMSKDEHNKCHGAGANELLFELYQEGIVVYNRETKRYERRQ